MRFNQPRQGNGPRLPRAGRSTSAVIGCVLAFGVSYSQLLYRQDVHSDRVRSEIAPLTGRRREAAAPEITVTTRFGTLQNTSAAVDLFATMLRSVEMARERIARGKR
jgi:hypothetical protein